MGHSDSPIGYAVIFSVGILSLCIFFGGFFVVMAESGGKDSRPDLLVAIVSSTAVVAFGPRRVAARRPWLVFCLIVAAGLLGPMPLILELFDVVRGMHWSVPFDFSWYGSLVCAVFAAIVSRTGKPPKR